MGLTFDAMDRLIESQIFFPDRIMVMGPHEMGLASEDVWITTGDNIKIHGWLVPADNSETLVLFFHGNAGNISHRLDNVKRLHEIGLGVLIVDYRGYGRSEGSISEKGLYQDALAAYEYAWKYSQERGLRLVIFGRSLGGVAAVYVASNRECSGVILESTFTNLGSMASRHFPIPGMGAMLSQRFDSLSRIARIKAPILFFHGDRDEIVPYDLGRQLYGAANTDKSFVTLEGAGHNDTYIVAGKEYFDKWTEFIESLPEPKP
jgi:hypothetical protein